MSNNCPSGLVPSLPFELIILIAENLCLSDVITLLRVNRSFWVLLVWIVNRTALLPRYRKIAFLWAAKNRNKALMSLLIEKGRNFLVKRSDTGAVIFRPPQNPAYTATLIKTLLELRGKIVVQDSFDSSTPLHEAARSGQFRATKLMLEAGAELEIADFRGWTPLFHATWEGHLNIVRSLIKRGCDVNARENHQMTPLHLAAIQGDLDIVRELLNSGADCNIIDFRGWTAIEMREYTQGSSDAISVMILKKLDPDYVSSLGQTALHMAVILRDLEIAVYFLDQGVDINYPDVLGCTALHDAVVSGHREMVKLLLSRGAEVDAMDSQGKTPLHCLLIHWPQNIISIAWALLDHGADVRLRDNEGDSVLDSMTSFEVFRTDTEKLLLQRLLGGMDIDFTSKYGGGTLLNIAVEFGGEDCIRVLLDNGVDINDFNQSGMTALHQAVSIYRPGILPGALQHTNCKHCIRQSPYKVTI